MNTATDLRRSDGRSFAVWCIVFCTVFLTSSLLTVRVPIARAIGDTGYRDFSFGLSGNSTPTGEKPESKLWWNDGVWWGSLYNDQARAYHIYRLDSTTQRWIDTGTPLDNRPASKADTLWDSANQKLYVVSHIFTFKAVETRSNFGRLYRYSYNPGTRTYSLDVGFPVDVTRGQSETLVLAKDSAGQLWVTYVENIVDALGNVQRTRVMVNNSNCHGGGDANWCIPFELPVPDAGNLTADDISSIVAFNGRIGVMWSNQGNRAQQQIYFAVHVAGAPREQWQSVAAYGAGTYADDHINLKAFEAGGTGKVFATIKTNYTGPQDPYIELLECEISSGCTSDGNWKRHVVYRYNDNVHPYTRHTRPILVIDSENRKLHVFTSPEAGGAIFHKVSDLDNIAFPEGPGEFFTSNATDRTINNVTSTKQDVNSTTDLVVLASDQNTRFYVHNYLDIQPGSTTGPTPTVTTQPPPATISQVYLPLVQR